MKSTSPTAAATPNPWGELSATRHSLLARLQRWDDQTGWQRFFDGYGRLLYLWAIRAGLSDAEAQEAVQDTVVSVAKAMREQRFEHRGTGSFKGWLYGVARHRIADTFRRRRDREVATEDIEDLAGPAEPELERLWDAEWSEHRLREALALTQERVSLRQFQIFDLYVLREWPVEKIKAALDVSRAQIYMAKLRVGAAFREALRRVDGGE